MAAQVENLRNALNLYRPSERVRQIKQLSPEKASKILSGTSFTLTGPDVFIEPVKYILTILAQGACLGGIVLGALGFYRVLKNIFSNHGGGGGDGSSDPGDGMNINNY